MAFWTTAWPFGSFAPPNLGHIPPKPNMLQALIISVGEQVKRWPQVTPQEPACSRLAVEILLP
jgi:hypothetical protein